VILESLESPARLQSESEFEVPAYLYCSFLVCFCVCFIYIVADINKTNCSLW
jgi:hypothetical protein